MHRLTREVRFAVNPGQEYSLAAKPTNSYGGFPSPRGFGPYLTLQCTLSGELDPQSNYLINIRDIDAQVRQIAIPLAYDAIHRAQPLSPDVFTAQAFEKLRDSWIGTTLECVRLAVNPYLSYSVIAGEAPMIRVSQKFEFSATHRLHNPALTDAQNIQTFGKCNNPHGHGHNYELQVTLRGKPGQSGLLSDLPQFEAIVARTVIDKFDHKNLNIELPEFAALIPTVENIAAVIYKLLKPQFAGATQLASVTVWETPKTWCEYSED